MQGMPTAYGVRTGTNLQKGIRLKKREFITNVGHNALGAKGHKLFRTIRSSSNGVLTSLAELGANVGLTKSFPWLSNVAQFFDKFILHQCKFEYVPSTGSTTQGTVALCPTYKSDESTEGVTKADLLDRAGSSRSATWQSNSCSLDPKKCTAALKSHFVRTGEVADKKVTDPARIDVLVETPASDDGSDVGELWVDYDVSLEVPKGKTDERSGSAAMIKLQGASGSAKTLTFQYKADPSSIIDWDKYWVEPDPLGDYYWVHFPFKKQCCINVDIKMTTGASQTYTIASQNQTVDSSTSGGYFHSTTIVSCGLDPSGTPPVHSEEKLKYGLRVGIVMSSTVENWFTILASEIGESLYEQVYSWADKLLPCDGPESDDDEELKRDISGAIDDLKKKKKRL